MSAKKAKKSNQKALEEFAKKEAARIDKIVIASIESPEQFQQAGELRREVKTAEKKITSAKRQIVDPLNQALKNVRALFRPMEDRCKETLSQIDREMRSYEAREEARRREEEQRLQALADKENEKVQKRAEKRAEKARAAGDEEKAADILTSVPEITMPTVAQKEVPKLEGVKRRSHWKAKVANPRKQRELLQLAIAEFNAKREDGEPKIMDAQFWAIDEKALHAHAKTTKGELSVPGVEFYDEPIYATESS